MITVNYNFLIYFGLSLIIFKATIVSPFQCNNLPRFSLQTSAQKYLQSTTYIFEFGVAVYKKNAQRSSKENKSSFSWNIETINEFFNYLVSGDGKEFGIQSYLNPRKVRKQFCFSQIWNQFSFSMFSLLASFNRMHGLHLFLLIVTPLRMLYYQSCKKPKI